jgi:hypothetical protein
LTGLVLGGTYHYRIVATNSKGTATGPDESFEATPPALIEGPWATNVASTSATLAARIDPLGAKTEYRLEYGTSISYGHTLSGNAGEGMGYVPTAFYHPQDLEPGTTYHYRVVTVSEVGTVEGADHTFTTQPAGGNELTLPDGRAWELVSPADKKGAVIEPFGLGAPTLQTAGDGSAIFYVTTGPHVGEEPESNPVDFPVISRRGRGVWTSQDLTTPKHLLPEGISQTEVLANGTLDYLLSSDLSSMIVEPAVLGVTQRLSPEATERTLYVRHTAVSCGTHPESCYTPLVTPVDVPPGTKFGGEEAGLPGSLQKLVIKFVDATPDLSHVVIQSPLALTPDAVSVLESVCSGSVCAPSTGARNLYESGSARERLRLINVLPNGEVTKHLPGESEVNLAGTIGGDTGSAQHAISSDGRWVAWTLGSPYDQGREIYRALYVRDMVAGTTIQLGSRGARYQTMNSDGSRIFFLEKGELHMFDTGSGVRIDLTASHGGESTAGVREAVSDVSEDGSSVYFVAAGVLATGGISGEDNLYVLHETSGVWSTKYVATLSSEDENSWAGQEQAPGGFTALQTVDSRVSPNGRYLAFMSSRALTGYDNTDAVSGRADEEVYVYDAVAGRLVCASCNPTGARPIGLFDLGQESLVDGGRAWQGRWLAGNIPGWDRIVYPRYSRYQPRYLSDSGRLFFDSQDALVPQDTNGLEDVYQYEPVGVGGCNGAATTFSVRSGGCVGLLSSGTSSGESAFVDASENGDDAFFMTSSKLTGADYDTSPDLYDAHVCSAAVPCTTEPVSAPPCTSGDSCKAAPSPQPEIFGPAPSATFSGIGNVVEEPKSTVRHKPKAKAKKHARQKKRKAKRARSRTHRPSGKGKR